VWGDEEVVNWAILGFAIAFFVVGLILFVSSLRAAAAGQRHIVNVFIS
jgi:hypothetical protein